MDTNHTIPTSIEIIPSDNDLDNCKQQLRFLRLALANIALHIDKMMDCSDEAEMKELLSELEGGFDWAHFATVGMTGDAFRGEFFDISAVAEGPEGGAA